MRDPVGELLGHLLSFLVGICLLIISFLFLPFVVSAREARRKRQGKVMSAKADDLGLDFSGKHDTSLPNTLMHLDSLARVEGSKRFAFNVMEGKVAGRRVVLFDYHYATSGEWWWSPSWAIPNYVSIVVVRLEQKFPELIIGPEGGGLFRMIAEAFGAGDIDFESYEFSERFDVRSNDKKFAYDFCNSKMIEYLLDKGKVSLEVDQSSLAMGFEEMHDVNRIGDRLKTLLDIRDLIPNYLFASPSG